MRSMRVLALATIVAMLVAACGTSSSPSAGGGPAASIDTSPVTVTLWDYYGESHADPARARGVHGEVPIHHR